MVLPIIFARIEAYMNDIERWVTSPLKQADAGSSPIKRDAWTQTHDDAARSLQRGLVPTVMAVLLLHYIMAVLVLLPRTRAIRLGLLPLALGLPYYAATAYDVSGGDPEFQSHGYNYTVCSCVGSYF